MGSGACLPKAWPEYLQYGIQRRKPDPSCCPIYIYYLHYLPATDAQPLGRILHAIQPQSHAHHIILTSFHAVRQTLFDLSPNSGIILFVYTIYPLYKDFSHVWTQQSFFSPITDFRLLTVQGIQGPVLGVAAARRSRKITPLVRV